ncbi:hypothetical protein C8Q76DRAFT_72274 [Earliella scabrosa]|nr:hypothetical protein C8Q76DRAFT_72274 [Earliella scabrosa]
MGQDTRVHMLELSYTRGKQLRLVFHNQFLKSLLPLNPGPQTRATFDPVELGWDQWGPEHTRAVSAPDYSHATWSAYGSRVIPARPAYYGPGTMSMAIFDFNVHPKRQSDPTSAIPTPDDRVYTVVQTRDRIEPEDLFEDAVETSLPYAMTVRNAMPSIAGYFSFHIDHEVLLGMKFQWDGEGHLDSDVYIF